MQAQTIITSALRLIGLIRVGQTAATNEIAEAEAVLNDLVDSWSTQRLGILYVASTTYSLTNGTANYTIGPAGTLTGGVRPQRIESATCNIPNPGGTGLQEYQVKILSRDEWTDIKEKGATANVVQALYYDRAFPVGNVKLWPVPNQSSISLTLYAWVALASWPDLTTDVPIAYGYSRALQYNLAVELGARFALTVPPDVKAIAMESLNAVRSLNAEMEEPAANTPAEAAQHQALDGGKQ